MRKQSIRIALAVGAMLAAVSCVPIGQPIPGTGTSARTASTGGGGGSGSVSLPGQAGVGSQLNSDEIRQLRNSQGQSEQEVVISSGGNRGSTSGSNANRAGEYTDAFDLPPLPAITVQYRYAVPVPGRKGWVYNPYTNRPVDVRGVESGRLIYDERDPANRYEDGTLKPVAEMPNKFRVP